MKSYRKFHAAIIALTVCIGLCTGCSATEKGGEPDFSGVRAVCELSTLKCYYHNVAKGGSGASGLFGDILGTGYKKVWTEYDGVVEVGIDVNEVSIGKPGSDGVVEVHVPDAKILSVSVDSKSFSDPVTDTGFLTEVTTEEKTVALQEAQKTMEKIAEQNNAMKKQAHERARSIIEGYVKNVGKEIGESYMIKWV